MNEGSGSGTSLRHRLQLRHKKRVNGNRELQRAATYTPVEPVASALIAQVV